MCKNEPESGMDCNNTTIADTELHIVPQTSHAVTRSSSTPLHIAACKGHSAVVYFLITEAMCNPAVLMTRMDPITLCL